MSTLPSGLLPETFEGDSLGDEDPVRFDWSKTTRKSAHNARMKQRIIADIIAHRTTLYKYVPERDFDPKVLDAGFDQAFTTMRQKFRTQQDEAMAQHNRAREEQKALKARRKDRKKSVRVRFCAACSPPHHRMLNLPAPCTVSETRFANRLAHAPARVYAPRIRRCAPARLHVFRGVGIRVQRPCAEWRDQSGTRSASTWACLAKHATFAVLRCP